MSVPVIAFFNNKGGVGKTSLVYHLAWMYADHGITVLAADLDPQANLSVAFLEEDRLEKLWSERGPRKTIFGSVLPLITGEGDVRPPHVEALASSLFDSGDLGLVVGDLRLSSFEDELSESWAKCLDGRIREFRVISAFWRTLQDAAQQISADFILVDLGPNLGAINRSALISSDYVVVPLSPDLFSLQGLKNLGPTLRRWRQEWHRRLEVSPDLDLALPEGKMEPAGYVVLQHSVRLNRPVKAYEKWMAQIPQVYTEEVLDIDYPDGTVTALKEDRHCLGLLKHYRSLMPMAQEANKPIFFLKPADGAIGSHLQAVKGVYRDFAALAESIARRVGVRWSSEAA